MATEFKVGDRVRLTVKCKNAWKSSKDPSERACYEAIQNSIGEVRFVHTTACDVIWPWKSNGKTFKNPLFVKREHIEKVR